MARDLIPPLSPAGRPAPDGTTHLDGATPHLIELPPEPPRSPAQPAQQPPPPGPSEFRNRFGFLLGALGGVFVAAALALTVALSMGGDDAVDDRLAPNWSAWQPSDTSLVGGAAQIAAKVGAQYRQADGKQLVHVSAGSLDSTVALRSATGKIEMIDDPGVIYEFDGLGPSGSIKGGKPTTARLRLLHREALELALYTFRYLPEVKEIVTLLPPPPPTPEELAATETAKATALAAQAAATKAKETRAPEDVAAAKAAIAVAEKAATTVTTNPNHAAIFYRPGDLLPQLRVPLEATLPAPVPKAEALSDEDAQAIDALTLANRFLWSVPDPGEPLLVLDR